MQLPGKLLEPGKISGTLLKYWIGVRGQGPGEGAVPIRSTLSCPMQRLAAGLKVRIQLHPAVGDYVTTVKRNSHVRALVGSNAFKALYAGARNLDACRYRVALVAHITGVHNHKCAYARQAHLLLPESFACPRRCSGRVVHCPPPSTDLCPLIHSFLLRHIGWNISHASFDRRPTGALP